MTLKGICCVSYNLTFFNPVRVVTRDLVSPLNPMCVSEIRLTIKRVCSTERHEQNELISVIWGVILNLSSVCSVLQCVLSLTRLSVRSSDVCCSILWQPIHSNCVTLSNYCTTHYLQGVGHPRTHTYTDIHKLYRHIRWWDKADTQAAAVIVIRGDTEEGSTIPIITTSPSISSLSLSFSPLSHTSRCNSLLCNLHKSLFKRCRKKSLCGNLMTLVSRVEKPLFYPQSISFENFNQPGL